MNKHIFLFLISIFIGLNIFSLFIQPNSDYTFRYFDYFPKGLSFNITSSLLSNSFNIVYLYNRGDVKGIGFKFTNYGNIDYTQMKDSLNEISPINYPYVYKTENLSKYTFNFFYGKTMDNLRFMGKIDFDYMNYVDNSILMKNSLYFKKSFKTFDLLFSFNDLFPILNFENSFTTYYNPSAIFSFVKKTSKNDNEFNLGFDFNFGYNYYMDSYFIYKNFSFYPSLFFDYKNKNLNIICKLFSDDLNFALIYEFSSEIFVFFNFIQKSYDFKSVSIGINYSR